MTHSTRSLALAVAAVAGVAILILVGPDFAPQVEPTPAARGGAEVAGTRVPLASVDGERERALVPTPPGAIQEDRAEEAAGSDAAVVPEHLDPFDVEVSVILDPEWQAKAFKRRLYPGDVKGRSSAEKRAAAWEDPAVREAYARLQERYVLRDYGWNLYGSECQRFFDQAKPQPSFDQVVSPTIRKWIRDNGTPELRQRIATMEEWVYEQLFERGHTGRVNTGLASADDTETSALIRGAGHEIHEWALRGLPYFRDAQDVIYLALGLKLP